MICLIWKGGKGIKDLHLSLLAQLQEAPQLHPDMLSDYFVIDLVGKDGQFWWSCDLTDFAMNEDV